MLTIWFSLGRVKRAVVRSLLAGEIVDASRTRSSECGVRQEQRSAVLRTPHSAFRIFAAILFVAAVALAFYAAQLGGEAQAGAFLGAGAALLVSLLLLVVAAASLGRAAAARCSAARRSARLAFRNAGRNVGRSAATIALDGLGGVSDRRRQRLSDEPDRAGRRRLRSVRRKLAADL